MTEVRPVEMAVPSGHVEAVDSFPMSMNPCKVEFCTHHFKLPQLPTVQSHVAEPEKKEVCILILLLRNAQVSIDFFLRDAFGYSEL